MSPKHTRKDIYYRGAFAAAVITSENVAVIKLNRPPSIDSPENVAEGNLCGMYIQAHTFTITLPTFDKIRFIL